MKYIIKFSGIVTWLFRSLLMAFTFMQGQIVTIEYSGISPKEDSPHWGVDLSTHYNPFFKPDKTGSWGIPNPERGYQLRAGYFDLYPIAEGLASKGFYENVNGDEAKGIDSLKNYMKKFCRDGITLVELEQYLHFTEAELISQPSISSTYMNQAKSLFTETLDALGLKANFIMNSDFKYLPGHPELGQSNAPYHTEYLDIDTSTVRVKGLKHFMNQMSDFYSDIQPYVAVANVGWIYSPHDFNTYRLSNRWLLEDWKWDLFQDHDDILDFSNSGLKNFHGDWKESVQRFSWGVAHYKSNPTNTNTSPFSITRKMVLDHMLGAFPQRKLLTNSLTPYANYILTTLGLNNESGSFFASRNAINKFFLAGYNDYSGNVDSRMEHIFFGNKFLRLGLYDGAFAGNTYSSAWTIGNGETTEVHWMQGYKDGDVGLGADWADQPIFTDNFLVRQYRSNLWIHGDMPFYETPNKIDPDLYKANGDYKISSFANHFGYSENLFYDSNEDGVGEWNTSYDYNLLEGICSSRLNSGLAAITKLKYFNYTSLGIGHNNYLDGRSPYEMPHGYTGDYDTEYKDEGIPKRKNTAVRGWVNEKVSKEQLEEWGMPISDRYFESDNGKRSVYEYIRDHLGYRLELQNCKMFKAGDHHFVDVDIINRGFAAPQNPRDVIFVILNNDDEIVHYVYPVSNGHEDWRNWQPDTFSISPDHSNSNFYYNSQNVKNYAQYSYNLDNVNIGGIPLGKFNSDWHESPIIDEYEPIAYTIRSNGIPLNYFNSNYRLGIWMPDQTNELINNPKYNVKFANAAKYIHCEGVTVLMTLGEDHDINSSIDSDGDGIVNNADPDPFNPKNFDASIVDVNTCFDCNANLHKEQPDINSDSGDLGEEELFGN